MTNDSIVEPRSQEPARHPDDLKSNYLSTPIPCLDMQLPDSQLHELAVVALSNTLSPMLGIRNYGFEGLNRKVVEVIAQKYPEAHAGISLDETARRAYEEKAVVVLHDARGEKRDEVVEAVLLSGEGSNYLDEYIRKMQELALRLTRIFFGAENVDAFLHEGTLTRVIDGRLSLRCYPKFTSGLGAHLDGNLFTLLWASQPGLQVLDDSLAKAEGITVDDIAQSGMPQFGCDMKDLDVCMRDVQVVDCDSSSGVSECGSEDVLFLNVGNAWLRLPEALRSGFEPGVIESAVLHRVAERCTGREGSSEVRYSIPYLVDFFDKAL